MSETFEEIDVREPPQQAWSGIIASNPNDFADPVQVTIPGLEATLRWKCRKWQARNDVDLPQRGNPCLVMFDENNDPWVVAWWPY